MKTKEQQIGKAAKIARIKCDLSQLEAADRLGISRVYLGNIERGKRRMSMGLLEKMNQLYGMDVYLLSME